MAKTSLKGNPVTTSGDLPRVGSDAPDFELVSKDLQDIRLFDLKGNRLLLNVFVSLDTAVCAMSVRRFNSDAAGLPGVKVLCISADLPFAHARFCETEGIDGVINLSCFRSDHFGSDYGLEILDGPLRGLLARCVIILDESGRVAYSQLVPEISEEPDYEEALAFLRGMK